MDWEGHFRRPAGMGLLPHSNQLADDLLWSSHFPQGQLCLTSQITLKWFKLVYTEWLESNFLKVQSTDPDT
jgi:hypothetical protein